MMGAPQSWVACIIVWQSASVQGGLGVLRASQSLLKSNGDGRVFNLFVEYGAGVEILSLTWDGGPVRRRLTGHLDTLGLSSHAFLSEDWRRLMRRIILTALITCLAVGTAAAQSCDSKAVSANGKPLHGAAKMSFVKKCKRDACASKAVSAEGKPLHGAAKNSFMAKCMRTA
jgi:hypothetical protein